MEFLSQFSDSAVSITSVAVLIFSFVLGILKGVVRLVLGAVGLVAAALVFWFLLKSGDDLSRKIVEEPEPWLGIILAGIGAIATYTVVRHLLGFILRPIIGGADQKKGNKLISGVLGLVIGVVGIWGGGVFSQQIDAKVFLDKMRTQQQPSWIHNILSRSQESWLGDVQKKTDPTRSGSASDLIKLLTIEKFSEQEQANQILENLPSRSEIQKLLKNPEVSRALEQGNLKEVLDHKSVKSFLENPNYRSILNRVDWRSYFDDSER